MSIQHNFNRFPFALIDGDDDATAAKWADESGALALLDSEYDDAGQITPDELDSMIYGRALGGLI